MFTINYQMTWLIILWLTASVYLTSDGTAIGMGCIYTFCDQQKKQFIMSFLLPVWDANQTWLVFTLAGLYAGFSSYFALTMMSHYLPFIFLVVSLLIRGAAIEYLSKAKTHLWSVAFTLSSFCIILLQATIISLLLKNFLVPKLIPVQMGSALLLSSIILSFYIGLALLKCQQASLAKWVVLIYALVALFFNHRLAVLASPTHYHLAFTVIMILQQMTLWVLICICVTKFSTNKIARYFMWLSFTLLSMTLLLMVLPAPLLVSHQLFPEIPNIDSLHILTDVAIVFLPILALLLWCFNRQYKKIFTHLNY